MSKASLYFYKTFCFIVEFSGVVVSKGMKVYLFESWVVEFFGEAISLVAESCASCAYARFTEYIVVVFW